MHVFIFRDETRSWLSGKDELMRVQAKKKKEVRRVSNPVIARIPKKQWNDLGLDESDARVQQLMEVALSKDAFVPAVSRFLYWDAKQTERISNESTLVTYLSTFLFNLSDTNGFFLWARSFRRCRTSKNIL